MADFKTRKTIGGGKVVTRKGSKYEADILNEAKVLQKVAATDKTASKSTKKFWSDSDKAQGVGAKIVADKVSSAKAEGDYSKKIGRNSKSYDERMSNSREVQSYMERGTGATTGRKDFPFFKHTEKSKGK